MNTIDSLGEQRLARNPDFEPDSADFRGGNR